MLVLFETPAGFAIFSVLNEKKIAKVDNLFLEFETPEAASKILKLKHFEKFVDTTDALAAATAAVEGKVCKPLKKVLKKLFLKEAHDQLLVADAKLGSAIKDKLDISCVNNTSVMELMRCIRSQSDSLIGSLPKKEMDTMALGLAHSLSRFKLKFSPDKVDTMIVQAISLLDDLDKELNNYIMRCKEWYGWHFPELSKIVTDNIAFIKVVKHLGFRSNASTTDFSSILPEELEALVKESAEISMGSEISDEDLENIHFLADQIIDMSDYRTQLYEYMKARMMAIAPNLTILVGELVGARLIAHAGTLINLAKHPASTIQILGAEKALFRALKTKKDTPKYGLIYHAQLVGSASTKTKGKVSRMLAAKAALAARVDALGDETSLALGTEHKAYLEHRVRQIEEGALKRISGGARSFKPIKYTNKSEVRSYPTSADSTMGNNGFKAEPKEEADTEVEEPKKKKKKKKSLSESAEAMDESAEVKEEEAEPEVEGGKKKKKKKRKIEEVEQEEEVAEPPAEEEEETSGKKKKKKQKVKP